MKPPQTTVVARRWYSALSLALLVLFAACCPRPPKLAGLAELGYAYDTSALSRSARKQLRRDPGAPRTDTEIVQLGRALFLPTVRQATPVPEFAKAGCDELRASRFWQALRAERRVAGLDELDVELTAELARLLPLDDWLYPEPPLQEPPGSLPLEKIFKFRYDPALCGTSYDRLFDSDVSCKERAHEAFRLVLSGTDGGPMPQAMWLQLFAAATGEEIELPIRVLLTEIDGAVHGDASPDQPIRLNLLSLRQDPELLHITLAHEVFHLFQFQSGLRENFTAAHSGNSGAWFSEGTASWAEWIATDRLVDTRKYEELLTKPSISLWQRSYGFTPVVSFLNSRFVQMPTIPGVPGYPGSAVRSLSEQLEAALDAGIDLPAVLRHPLASRQLTEGYRALFTQMNSTFANEDRHSVKGPSESKISWSDLREQLKPYVVPLEVGVVESRFIHEGTVNGYAATVFEFVPTCLPDYKEGKEVILDLLVEPLPGESGSVLLSLLGTDFSQSSGGAASSYACELVVESADGMGLNPLGCFLEAGEPLKVRFGGKRRVRLAIFGVETTNKYSISAQLCFAGQPCTGRNGSS